MYKTCLINLKHRSELYNLEKGNYFVVLKTSIKHNGSATK